MMEPDANPDHPNPDHPDAETPNSEVAELAGRLFGMAREGDPAVISYVTAGVPVNLTNHAGDTLLMLAAYHGHAEVVSGLLELGADVNRANDKNQAPLAGAVFKSHDQVVRSLIAAGADPDAGTPTARDAATMFGREDYLGLLDQ
jgi:ankyrin repeat protein